MFVNLLKYRVAEESEVALKQMLLLNFIGITAIFSLVYVAVSLLIDFPHGVYAMFLNFVIFVITLLLFARHKVSYRTAAHLYVGNACLVAVLLCTYFSGGLFSFVLPWFILVPVISLLLLGISRDTTAWLVITMIITVGFGVLGLTGTEVSVNYDRDFDAFFALTCIAGLILIVFIVTHIFEREKAKAFHVIREKNREIVDSILYAKRLQDAICRQPA